MQFVNVLYVGHAVTGCRIGAGQFVSSPELPHRLWFLLTQILIKWIREGGVAATTLLHLVRKFKRTELNLHNNTKDHRGF
jgi:hypothetical protein